LIDGLVTKLVGTFRLLLPAFSNQVEKGNIDFVEDQGGAGTGAASRDIALIDQDCVEAGAC
jgi:hypothetical protein